MNRKALRDVGITNVDASLSWLLSLYYEVSFGKPNESDLALVKKHFLTSNGKKVLLDIFTTGDKDEVVERIDEYMTIFRDIGKYGSKKDCIKRINVFLKENKDKTFDDILKAAEHHVSKDDYPRKPHYFLYKGSGSSKIYPIEEVFDELENYVEKSRIWEG